MPRVSVTIAILLMIACADEPPRLNDLGDPCRSAGHICIDDDMIEVCEDKVWALSSCEALCAERGPAWIPDGCDGQCICVLADPDACTPDETICADELTVRTCSETQEWEDMACEDLCTTEGLNSAGCRMGDEMWMKPDACWCTSEGTACTEEEPSCIDDQTLARCEGGVWVFEDCTASCGGVGICEPFTEVDACSCS